MLQIVHLIIVAVGCALLSAFIIEVLEKWGWRQKAQLSVGSRFIHDMLGCDFCLGFWISVVISVVSAIVFGNAWYLLMPVFSAPLIRRIL